MKHAKKVAELQAKQAEAALRQSEAHNMALLDSMPDLMFLLDKNGVFLDYRAPSGTELAIGSSSAFSSRGA